MLMVGHFSLTTQQEQLPGLDRQVAGMLSDCVLTVVILIKTRGFKYMKISQHFIFVRMRTYGLL